MGTQTINFSLDVTQKNVIAKGFFSARNYYLEKAEGATIVDVEGREFIDFGGRIAVLIVGHSHPKVVRGIQTQDGKFTYTCFMVTPYPAPVQLAKKLCKAVHGGFYHTTIFANSSAETVVNAVKIASYAGRKLALIAFDNVFHGRSLLGMTLTSKVKPYKFGFGPFVPELHWMPFAYCYRCPLKLDYPFCDVACADLLNDFFVSNVAPETTAGIVTEPVQREGKFIVPPKAYFDKLKLILEKKNVLFIVDELQAGIGRPGTMFTLEHFDVPADLITMAKSLAAGMPLIAVVGRKEIMDAICPFRALGGHMGAILSQAQRPWP